MIPAVERNVNLALGDEHSTDRRRPVTGTAAWGIAVAFIAQGIKGLGRSL